MGSVRHGTGFLAEPHSSSCNCQPNEWNNTMASFRYKSLGFTIDRMRAYIP